MPIPAAIKAGSHALRTNATWQCTSVQEVIDLLPLEYREGLRKHSLVLGDYVDCWAELAVQVSKLKSHFNTDTLPTFIKGTKAPAVQISKEARATAPEKVKLLEDNHKASLNKQLQGAGNCLRPLVHQATRWQLCCRGNHGGQYWCSQNLGHYPV
ncbi:hypothetical protein BS17DRAFT_764432 [Gyrodon lividus]|nr:hypothetical protein BS17DRAFT_764432 [Gyrodon lividus]